MLTNHRERSTIGRWLVSTRAFTISIVVALLTMMVLPLSSVAADSTTVTLAPTSQLAVVGGTARVTATVKTGDVPQSGVVVQFTVSGTNTFPTIGVTNSQGQASFSYSSMEVGTDTVQATASNVPSNEATVEWITTEAANISLSPSSINAAVGSSQTWTATVTDSDDNPVAGVDVVYQVQGDNPKSATDAGSTNSDGEVTFSYTGTNAGSDTITAFTDLNGNMALDSGELSDTAQANWVTPEAINLSPSALTRYTDTPLTLTATVTDSDDNPVQGVVVNYTISGANPSSGTATTDADGNATFTDSGANAGIDTVHASVSGVSGPASATIQWIPGPATLALSASDTTPDVNTQVTITATLEDANGDPVPNVKMNFSASGANTASGSDTTDANGEATFSYTGTHQGSDTVSAYADFNGNNQQNTGEPSKTLTISWGGAASLSLKPSVQSQNVGTSASVTAQLTNPGGTVSGIDIHVTVSGANSTSGTITTDTSGKATFTYNGTHTGKDTVTAWADLNGNGVQNSGEPSATASVTWTAAPVFQPAQPAAPKAGCTYFSETQHNVCAGFLAYWNQFGGLSLYGFPLTEEFQENGLTVQYFERARFEWHPGAAPSRYDVLLGLLGNEVTAGRGNEAPFQATTAKSAADCTYYAVTGHNVCAGFRAYWNAFGGLATYGYPISEEFTEKNPDTGQIYTVQYFQRARFEWHPGEAPARYDVLLGRLGAQVLQMRYGVNEY